MVPRTTTPYLLKTTPPEHTTLDFRASCYSVRTPQQVSKTSPSSSPSPIILQDSEDALEMFKKVQNGMEKAVAKGRALTQKLATGP